MINKFNPFYFSFNATGHALLSTILFSNKINFNQFCTKNGATTTLVNDNNNNINKSKINLDLNLNNLLAECPDINCLIKQREDLPTPCNRWRSRIAQNKDSNTNTLSVDTTQDKNLIKFNKIKLLTELGLPANYELTIGLQSSANYKICFVFN